MRGVTRLLFLTTICVCSLVGRAATMERDDWTWECGEPYFLCESDGWDGNYCYSGDWYVDCWWSCYSCSDNPPGGGGSGGVFDATVTVEEADIRQDRIVVKLAAPSGSGTLNVKAEGTGVEWEIVNETRGSGTYTFQFVMESMPLGQYDRVVARWTVGTPATTLTSQKSVNFRAMGVHTGTSYNSPTESQCPGDATDDGDYEEPYYSCQFLDDVAKPRFLDEVMENGSGRSDRHGFVARPWTCSVHRGKFRLVDAPPGKYGSVNDSTVAVGDGHPYLVGSQTPTIVIRRGPTIYVKTVTDRCAACGSNLHLDHYSSAPGCTSKSVPSFGDYPVFHAK